MNLVDFLSKQDTTPKDKAKDWLHFCMLNVPSGALWAGDPQVANADDGCVVKVPRGQYVVEGIGLVSGRYRIVSRLRVRLKSAKDPKLGRKRGDTGTDSAMIGVCDIKAFDKACGPNAGDDVREAIQAQTRGGFGIITLKPFPGAVMPFVPTGSDGIGPVFALVSGGKCVGIELPFTDEEAKRKDGEHKQVAVSLLGDDTHHFITRRLADGSEASFWLGGTLKAGVQFFLWSNASSWPVDFRIRRGSGSVLKDWTPMKKVGGGGAKFRASETLKPGSYEFDFRIGKTVYSALKLTLR